MSEPDIALSNPGIPATPDELFRRLDALGIATETVRHAAVFTVDEAKAHRGEIAGGHCKNLFLKDKAGRLWLVVMLESSRLDMKAAQTKLGAARLSFASPELMRAVLGVDPGSVTPFTVINASAAHVQVVLEAAMMREAKLSYHPLTNTQTTTLASADLLVFLRAQGHEPLIVDFAP